MSNFYRAFEDKYRGNRQTILKRLKAYEPLLMAMKKQNPSGELQALDLGCGRGEWLKNLQSLGIQAVGVDLDEGMLEACVVDGLKVEKIDALTKLSQLKEQSVDIISAFHLIEHLPFKDVQQLVRQAFRVLKQGGVLILETPNPENIAVSTNSFYLDPTHKQPIPPELIAFLSEFSGFKHNTILRLQELRDVASSDHVLLSDIIYGVSPDYAVVAQKWDDLELVSPLKTIFDQKTGIEMGYLLSRYDGNTLDKQNRLSALEDNFVVMNTKIDAMNAQIDAMNAQIDAMNNSFSWKVTKPLRAMAKLYRRIKNKLVSHSLLRFDLKKQFTQKLLLPLLSSTKMLVLSSPLMKRWANTLLSPFPRLRAKILRLVLSPNSESIFNANSQLSEEAEVIEFRLKQVLKRHADKEVK